MVSLSLEGEETHAKREELLCYFHQSFDLFESLFELFGSDEIFYRQSEPTRHPMIFYFGHTAVFYINKLILANIVTKRINPRFESLFAVGVDEMLWDEESSRFEWPNVDTVREYRQQVRECIDHLIRTLPMTLPITQHDPFWAIWMGIEHERIHIETSSVLHRQMPIECIRVHEDFPLCPHRGPSPLNALVPITGKELTLGKGNSDQGLYGWDNEYGKQTFEVPSFEASRYLVSNGEFMEFVQDGGYRTDAWWDEEGLRYLSIRNAVVPPFWIPDENGFFRYRALAEEIEMPQNWPVEVNALEAEAFCRWKSAKENRSYRLPTEAEWSVMVRECGVNGAIYEDSRANLNLAHYASSVPVDRFAHGKIFDAVGNVWQWTKSPIDGFDGFAPHPWYDDFSLPTFDGKHNLIKGGSWISTGNEIVSTSRYAFRRHFIQHAGFRYVVAEESAHRHPTTLITDPEVIASCRFHYEEGCGILQECTKLIGRYLSPESSVMELGCGAGRLSMELSNVCANVTGIDFSARFIAVGTRLLEEGAIDYDTPLKQVRLDSLDVPYAKEKVALYQGDIYNLKPHLRGYGVIVVNNIQNTLIRERIDLQDLTERLEEGGYIIFLEPKQKDTGAAVVERVAEHVSGGITVSVRRKRGG